jgi:hypothetical protein
MVITEGKANLRRSSGWGVKVYRSWSSAPTATGVHRSPGIRGLACPRRAPQQERRVQPARIIRLCVVDDETGSVSSTLKGS